MTSCSRCGREGHYSVSEYFTCLKPDWKDKHIDPWIRKQVYHGRGSSSIISVCRFCGEESHKQGCRMNKGYPHWYPEEVAKPSFGNQLLLNRMYWNPFYKSLGRGGVGAMGTADPSGGTPSQQYIEDQQKLAEERIRKEKERQETEKKGLEQMRKTVESWEKEWTEYISSGTGIEPVYFFNNYKTPTNEKVVWIRPKIIDIVVRNLEYYSDDVRKLECIKTNYTFVPKGETKKKTLEINYIIVNPSFSCLPNALEDEGEYHALMAEYIGFEAYFFYERVLQIILAETTEINISTDSFGKNYIELLNTFFHIRPYEKVLFWNWASYWNNRRSAITLLPSYTKAIQKIETIKKKIILKEEDSDDQKARKEQILEQITILLSREDPTKKQGYFDEIYNIRAIVERKTLTKLNINFNSFIGNSGKIYDFNKFKLISQGTISLNDFPALKELTINLPYLDKDNNFAFQELNLTKTAPNLERLDLKSSDKLTKLSLGKKEELKYLDIRETSLTNLDLSETTLLKSDFGTKKFPTRNEDDELVKPFTLDGAFSSSNKINWGKKKDWKAIDTGFTEEFQKEWTKAKFTYEQCKDWINIGLRPVDADYAKWLRDTKHLTPEEVLNNGNNEDLRKEFGKK